MTQPDIAVKRQSLLVNRNFSPLFIGGLISEIGTFFTFIAVMFLALDITEQFGQKIAAQKIALITVSIWCREETKQVDNSGLA